MKTARGVAPTDSRTGTERSKSYSWHHLATDKNDISTVYGGPWTPLFKSLFTQAGMSLDAKENLVYLKGHKGPHPEDYHVEVYERLKTALAGCRTREQCRDGLMRALQELAEEVCTPGSRLYRLATRN